MLYGSLMVGILPPPWISQTLYPGFPPALLWDLSCPCIAAAPWSLQDLYDSPSEASLLLLA